MRSAPCALQLFSWSSLQRVGPEMAEPLAMGWDPSGRLLALAYAAEVLVVR
jgi:hypothetical protein